MNALDKRELLDCGDMSAAEAAFRNRVDDPGAEAAAAGMYVVGGLFVGPGGSEHAFVPELREHTWLCACGVNFRSPADVQHVRCPYCRSINVSKVV